MCMDENLHRLCAYLNAHIDMVMHTQINFWTYIRSLWWDSMLNFTQDVLAGDKLSDNYIFSLLIIFYPFINVIFFVKMVSKYLYIWLTKNDQFLDCRDVLKGSAFLLFVPVGGNISLILTSRMFLHYLFDI